ncbi:MAG: hypothetical protein GY842_27140 [bacterium]|nr:hypothetical protein [bacterium]
MTRRLRWCWWTAVVLSGIALAAIAASFVWMFGWTDQEYRYYIYLQHGMLCGNPNSFVPGVIYPPLPWYGHFEVFRSWVYEPWALVPWFDLADSSFKFPIHLFLVVFTAIGAYPVIPLFVRRFRSFRGLCAECAYDLTGNVSGVCPECGVRISPEGRRPRTMRKTVRRERYSVGASLAAAAFAFPFLLLFTGIITTILLDVVLGLIARWWPQPPDRVHFGVLVAVAVVIAWVLARMIYTGLRWRRVEIDDRRCATCGCDLAGDESGTCPDCGESV